MNDWLAESIFGASIKEKRPIVPAKETVALPSHLSKQPSCSTIDKDACGMGRMLELKTDWTLEMALESTCSNLSLETGTAAHPHSHR